MEAAGSSEILVSVYQTKWCQMPEDSKLHTDCREYINHTNNLNIRVLKIFRHKF
jgi:hypothetical protein